MYKFTDKEAEVRNVEIDLRHEAEILTQEFGIDMLYVRNVKYVRCKCFNDTDKTGDPNCKICFGSGHLASIEKVHAIESSNSAYSSTSSILHTNVGVTDQKNEVYYLQYPFVPKERDVLIKVAWDKQGYPVDIVKALEIVNVYEMRGDHGRVELNGCLVNDRTDLVPVYTAFLRRASRRIMTPLLKGGKTIWPDKVMTKLSATTENG